MTIFFWAEFQLFFQLFRPKFGSIFKLTNPLLVDPRISDVDELPLSASFIYDYFG